MFYSQENQDQLLETYVFKGFKRGIFVDVGAWDGVVFNNTLFFERERGWTGLNIEPHPDLFAKLVANRPTCTNVNVAITDRNGEGEFVAISGDTSMLSGLKENYDVRHLNRIARETTDLKTDTSVIQVPVKRLDTLFRETNTRRVHYLSIDAEGSEFAILRSIDFDFTFIDVIGFEANYPDTASQIVQYLESKGYVRLPIVNSNDVFMIYKDSVFTPGRLHSPLHQWRLPS
jgi:FkbM family methyltransferase